MATKNKRTDTAPTEPATKAHRTKRVKAQTALVEDPPWAEHGPAEEAVTPSALTPELDPTGSPMADETEDTAKSPTPAEQTPTAKKLSALDAAVKVLGETGQAMSCQELIAAMAARGYWTSPNGKTPSGTLYSALLRELRAKGDQARFCKTGRGKFNLRQTV
jgi:hypothetical protein